MLFASGDDLIEVVAYILSTMVESIPRGGKGFAEYAFCTTLHLAIPAQVGSLIRLFDGAILSLKWKDGPWDKFVMA